MTEPIEPQKPSASSEPKVSPETRSEHPPALRSHRSLPDLTGAHSVKPSSPGALAALTFAALGVVYGDIGTSPLYTVRQCVLAAGHSGLAGAGEQLGPDLLGLLSLIFWSLTMVVAVKYLGFIMKADNHGEGGILALLALVPETLRNSKSARIGWVSLLVLIGASLLYGDGIITPAISVLSAVEGLAVATDKLQPAVVPITVVILIGFFSIQSRGTESVGRYFGPVMLAWFLTLGGLGIYHILRYPSVLAALSPHHAVLFFMRHGLHGTHVLGAVVLAVTGCEALYADMGHFGARPIRIGWWGVTMPALVLNYFGQGALILRDPNAIENPFFAQVPQGWMTYGLVVLSTLAAIIASQALITGAYSLTHQAVQLGYFPRVTVRHTSHETEGQIYMPEINFGLAVACLILVFAFKTSSSLAAAYGMAVTGTMGITSIIYYVVLRQSWKWPLYKAVPLVLLFLALDVPFFFANIMKFFEGGYVPILCGSAFFVVMCTWKIGRSLLGEHIVQRSPPMDEFLKDIDKRVSIRSPGIGVFMASNSARVPPILFHHAARIRVLPETILLLTVVTEHVPAVDMGRRLETVALGAGFYRVIARCGFMETPHVPDLLADAFERLHLPATLAAAGYGAQVGAGNVTYYVGRETFLATGRGKMGRWSETLFAFLSRNAQPATMYFGIPPDQVIELGTQIDL